MHVAGIVVYNYVITSCRVFFFFSSLNESEDMQHSGLYKFRTSQSTAHFFSSLHLDFILSFMEKLFEKFTQDSFFSVFHFFPIFVSYLPFFYSTSLLPSLATSPSFPFFFY